MHPQGHGWNYINASYGCLRAPDTGGAGLPDPHALTEGNCTFTYYAYTNDDTYVMPRRRVGPKGTKKHATLLYILYRHCVFMLKGICTHILCYRYRVLLVYSLIMNVYC